MAWGSRSWHDFGPLATLPGRTISDHYLGILIDHVHPSVHTVFHGKHPIFQEDNAPTRVSKCVQEWFKEHDDELGHLVWPAQSLYIKHH